MDSWTFKIAAASRPYPGERENGDTWRVLRRGDIARVALIDGLGHGPEAAAAARAASDCLERSSADRPEDVVRQCHAALRGTRGVVMAVADIDCQARTLAFCSIGNIDCIVHQDGETSRLISYRGIVGAALPTVRVIDVMLTGCWSLLLHTDGITGRFDLAAELRDVSDPEIWVQRFLTRWARETDDATVVLITTD